MGDAAENDTLGVLDRMTSILEAFDQDDHGLGISELASRAGLPKSTVSRLVTTLVRQRYLERDGRRIHLGLRVFELGQLAAGPRDLRAASLPALADLRTATRHTVHLAIRDGRELVCIAVLRSSAAESTAVRAGGRLPIPCTALGKAVLANSTVREIDEILSVKLDPCTTRSITDPTVLRRQLDDIRGGRPALSLEEFRAGVSCMARAVFGPAGAVVGAISLSGSADGFDADRFDPALRLAALRVASRLSQGASGAV
ncbi:IclR family transcriptional regulator [Leifsonia flava]|uniref:IclR family transcriptional regulator n=1 Tax=Orlajensenia leifsoniae TaxID=2561933 RepID=A0A4Y9QVL4_9MICO|nr:IclR family transcriptional regulator [Leifsonia flava]TFV95146.1 IclR family transcriptional regulator [Leifsonia flava]